MSSVKVRFLVFLDELEPYLLKTLEDGPFVPMSSLSTFENPLPKCQNQWSNAESCVANEDKRLKSIIITCLPNDVMKSVIKCKRTKEMWNDLILAHEGPSDIRDTKIAALRLKFNAFKSLEGEKVNETFTRLKCFLNDLENNGVTIPQAEVNATFDSNLDVEEDQRTSNEFMADLNAEYHERALLANQKRFYKRSGRVGSARKPLDKSKETCFACGKLSHFQKDCPSYKTSTPSYPSSNNSFNKSRPYTPSFNQTSSQKSINYQKDYKGKYKGLKAEMIFLTKRIDDMTKGKIPGNIVKALGGKGRRKEKISSKEVVFTKADESSSVLTPEITSDLEYECDSQEPLPHLPKLIGAAPSGTSKSLISLSDLTLNMADLTLDTPIPKKTRPSVNVSPTYVIKKKTEKSHAVPKLCSDKKPFKECKYCGFNDHHSYHYEFYPGCEVCGSIAHEPSDCPKKHPNFRRPRIANRQPEPTKNGCSRHMTGIKQYLHIYSKDSGPKVVFGDDSSGDTKGYGSVNYNGITFTRVAYVNGLKQNLISINEYSRKMENLNKVRVKEPRSDNGTEFRNYKLEELCDEKGISQNFSSPCTPEQNGVAERRNKTLIEAARTMLNSAKLPKQFWGEAINTVCTQNRSIIVKRHGKTSYDLFRGRSPDISYFYMFVCLVHIHNHRNHLGKFDEKANDGFFLGYSLVAKAFRVTEGDAINFNEKRSFPDDEFLEPRSEVTQCPSNTEYFPYIPAYENNKPSESPILQIFVISEDPPKFTEVDNHPALNKHDQTELVDHFEPVEPQENVIIEPINRWSREKHIELVNIIGEPLAGITTRSRIRDSDAALASECLYVNFLSEMEPKKLIEALEEEGLEAIRIFLDYAAYMGFMVYQMDVKSAFLNGKISEEVYVQQPPGFESSEFPNHVSQVCQRYQANPKESHLVTVKRIFRYLKGTPNLGL
ncbi:retrovirus-related pol polyprotein from transposon TNT 1-94 [Tanacetum coccineum]